MRTLRPTVAEITLYNVLHLEDRGFNLGDAITALRYYLRMTEMHNFDVSEMADDQVMQYYGHDAGRVALIIRNTMKEYI